MKDNGKHLGKTQEETGEHGRGSWAENTQENTETPRKTKTYDSRQCSRNVRHLICVFLTPENVKAK